jgi:hypothetical protein
MATWFGILGGLCTGALILPIFILWFWWMKRYARRYSERLQTLLPEWANKEGFGILFQERLPFWSTPFVPSSYVVHYRVVVEDAQGRRRRGWVQFGGWPLGIFSQRVRVVWEEPQPAQDASSNAASDPRNDPLWDDWLDH